MTFTNKFRGYLLYFSLIYFVFLLIPPFFYKIPERGIDPSWNIAINLAYKYHLVFGKDFVFTYGPLGVLHTRLPIAINIFVYLLFDLYFLSTFFLILKNVFKRHFSYGVVAFIFVSIIMAMYEAIDQWYFLFFLFFLFSFIKKPENISYLIQALILSLICFYIKVSLGITGILILFMSLTYALFRRKITWVFYIFVIALFMAALWASALLLNVDVKSYVITSLQFINDYNDSMFVALSGDYTFFIYPALLCVGLIFGWIIYYFLSSFRKGQIIKHFDELFIYSIVALCVFVSFKSGFVRADGHLNLFFKSIGLFAGFLFLYAPQKFERKMTAWCCWIVLAASFYVVNSIPGGYKSYPRILNFAYLPVKIGEFKSYLWGIEGYNRAFAASEKLDSGKNKFKELIGDHSADIVPSEISEIYFNGLRYNPRPVIQSYAAYNSYLDSLNFEKYMSVNAPDYVLFSLSSIDNRFPYFDEPKTKLALLNHYRIVGEINGYQILKKQQKAKELNNSSTDTVQFAKLGEDIPVKDGNDLQYARLILDYNLFGKLRRLFYQPPALQITLTLENGEKESYRAIKPILAEGILINKYIDSEQEFQMLMQSDGKSNTRVKSFRIESDKLSNGFVNSIKIITYHFSFPDKTDKERTEDSISVVNLMKSYDEYKPILLYRNNVVVDSLLYNVEVIKSHSALIRVGGWAFKDKINNTNATAGAVLRSGDKVYQIPSESQERPDLTSYFKRKDIGNSGFVSKVEKSSLPTGDYLLGVAVFDTVSKTVWINYTDRHVLIETDYRIEKIGLRDLEGEKNDIEYNIETIQEVNGHIHISGWAFVKNIGHRDVKTNIILKNGGMGYKVNVDTIYRKDVIDYFRNDDIGYCGFSVNIPKDKLPVGEYTIGIEKNYYGGKKHSAKFTDKKIKIGTTDAVSCSQITELPPTENLYSGIDLQKNNKETLTISGWAIQNFKKVQNSKVRIILKNGNLYFASGTEVQLRPDVTKFFKNKGNLDNCGFTARISKESLPKGKYQIGINIYQEGKIGVVKFTDHFITKE